MVDLEDFMKAMQADFLAGHLEELSKRFLMPLVVYSVAGVVVLRTVEEFLQRTALYRDAMMAMNVATSQIAVVSQDALENERLRVTVRVTDFDAGGEMVTGSLIRYFLKASGETYAIEMIEYLEAPLPSDEVERLVH